VWERLVASGRPVSGGLRAGLCSVYCTVGGLEGRADCSKTDIATTRLRPQWSFSYTALHLHVGGGAWHKIGAYITKPREAIFCAHAHDLDKHSKSFHQRQITSQLLRKLNGQITEFILAALLQFVTLKNIFTLIFIRPYDSISHIHITRGIYKLYWLSPLTKIYK
jgi:hypothetical protein